MGTTAYRTLIDAAEDPAPVLAHRGRLWSHRDIAAFLTLGKSATNEVMAAADFPAPVVGNQRYRRYIPDDVIAWAIARSDAEAAERRRRHRGH